jgi:predicted DNA-binding WGR domain protein
MSMATAQHAVATDWPRMILRRVDPTRNMSRFWSARLQPSLFEEVLLVRNWGRIGSRGQERSYWFSSKQAALAAFNKITAAKCRRGYAADVECRTAKSAARDWAIGYARSSQAAPRPQEAGAA